MSKLSFLEKEIMSLSISVSYLRKVANKKELNASLPVLDVTTGISEQDDEYYQEEIEEAVYQYESQASQPAPDFIVQEVEAVETQDETQDGQYETEVEMLFETPEITQNESLNEDVLIISPKKKRSRRASDVQLEETQEPKLMKCTSMLNLLPLNNEDDLQMLDDYLISNEDETIKFVAYLKKAKFDKGLKSAFFSLMTANMLLEFNYNGKGQMKRALNKYRIFKTIIFGE